MQANSSEGPPEGPSKEVVENTRECLLVPEDIIAGIDVYVEGITEAAVGDPPGPSDTKIPDRGGASLESVPKARPGLECASEVEEVVECTLASRSTLKVSVIGGQPVSAVVDTAAEVSIPQPPTLREVVLHAAERDMKMRGTIVGPLSIELGDQMFSEEVYVAPIRDHMLQGLGFLRERKAANHLKDPHMQLGGQRIPLWYSDDPGQQIAQVHVLKRVIVPPNAVKRITGVLDQRLGGFMFNPQGGLQVLVPSSVHRAGDTLECYVINSTDRHLRMTCSEVLGEAEEIKEGEMGPPTVDKGVLQLSVDEGGELPPHLEILILRGITWQIVLAFLDDVIVLGRIFDDHLDNLEEVLGRFAKFGLKLKPKKSVTGIAVPLYRITGKQPYYSGAKQRSSAKNRRLSKAGPHLARWWRMSCLLRGRPQRWEFPLGQAWKIAQYLC
ncbi:uncharacterized protein LOC121430868 [Lytechinus variegatus]|uniref:uncharacterized protein LOC121430868 n=1 Tax=Lytechinus variegatus TaxID=7654 RepID=UPI001BB15D77|nr:uncharacterized protein LOC121430868 [Lytechinus variegatus]